MTLAGGGGNKIPPPNERWERELLNHSEIPDIHDPCDHGRAPRI